MNSFLVIIVGLKLIFFFELVVSQSPCMNMGQYNSTSKSCSCFPGYSGTFCQYVDCTKQALKCGNYSKSYCLFSVVASYCPELCSNPICACGFNKCLNNGTFNASDCSCQCPQGFFGTTCESTNSSEPLVCPPSDQYLCQNHGAFNNRTCRCDCFPGYSGQFCEALICNVSDPATCRGYNQTLCTLSLVNAYCPHLCGSCPGGPSSISGLNVPANINAMPTFAPLLAAGSVTSAPSSSAATKQPPASVTSLAAAISGSKVPCENMLTCKNSGVFSNSTCSCQCFPGYKGKQCDSLDCTVSDPAQCSNYTQTQCALRLVYNYCPHLCGKCQTIVTLANNRTCQYLECIGGYFSRATCSCLCYPNWSGQLCDQLNCDIQTQPSLCLNYTVDHCFYQQIHQYCPILCGSCDEVAHEDTSTVSSTTQQSLISVGNKIQANAEKTPALGGAPAAVVVQTTESTPCTIVTSCFNGGQLDPDNPCKCQCYPRFTGSMCELLNCGRSDPSACTSLAPTQAQCASSYIFSSACPFSCGLCKMNTINQQINTLELAASVTEPVAAASPPPAPPAPPHTPASAPTCIPLKCASGVTFNPVTCICPCPTGFVDDICSAYDCELGDKDSAECFGMDCTAPGSNIICPQTCFNCPNPIA